MYSTITRFICAGRWGLTALWLSGCGAHALTASLGTSATPVASASPEAHAGDGTSGQPSCTAEDAKENCHHWTVLVGYPVEDARQRARAAGFTGPIEVGHLDEHDAACKDGTVCGVTPKRWELNQGDTLTLWVNRKVTITAPE